jgi:ribosome-binding factor A
MSSHFKRTDRIGEMIQRKLAVIIPQEVKDPRMKGLITVSAVTVDSELAHAKVYVTVINADKTEALSILNAAASFLRTALARSITLRTVPQLHFIYDESIEYGQRLSRLIDKVNPPDVDDDSAP